MIVRMRSALDRSAGSFEYTLRRRPWRRRRPHGFAAWYGIALLLLLNAPGSAQQPHTTVQLPAPSGAFPVGRQEFHWIDSTRTDPFSPNLTARREVMVYVWYPAVISGAATPAPYIPHEESIRGSIGDSLFAQEFGSATEAVKGGRVRSYAVEHAVLVHAAARLPVLLFSHGFGESSLTYSAQLTDLASHGYVVFAIEHPHDAYAVWLGDDHIDRFASAAWDSARKRERGAVAYQLAQVPIRTADIRFVLDKIVDLASRARPLNPFSNRLDLGRIGAFGHSLGGVAAASACRIDARIRACANEDADDDGRPFDGGWAAQPIKQPFLFVATGHSIYVSPRTPLPPDSDLVRMKLTRSQYDSIVGLYQRNQDEALASFPAGAERVMLEAPDLTHRTFIDLKLLQADAELAQRHQEHYLDLIRCSVRAFFDASLRGVSSALPADSILTVQHFPARAR